MMHRLGGATPEEEIARIRAEYERRRAQIPRDFYCWGRPANLFFHVQLVRRCIELLRRAGWYPLDGLRILDVGCGRGDWLLEFCQWGASPRNLAGIDLDVARIEEARERLPGVDLRAGDAQELPWGDAAFDLVTQFTVFTSILHDGVKRRVASEMMRVLAPGGAILWYDFRYDNPSNPNVRGLCPEEVCSLFPSCDIELRSVTLAPPLARAVVPRSWILGLMLESLPFLRTHLLGLIRKQRSVGGVADTRGSL